MARRTPASQLKILDLPTFGRPTIETLGTFTGFDRLELKNGRLVTESKPTGGFEVLARRFGSLYLLFPGQKPQLVPPLYLTGRFFQMVRVCQTIK